MFSTHLTSTILLSKTLLASACALVLATSVPADEIHFTDVAPALGVDYLRGPSADYAISRQMQEDSLIAPLDPAILPFGPMGARGKPGVAIFDADGDRDLDVFVTNGPGRSNVLLVNQLTDSGELAFVDQAAAAGLDAPDMDGNGACAGDLDNDGDPDLLVLGRAQPNRLFENRGVDALGQIQFAEIAGGVGSAARSHLSCAFGDVDGDGLLDLAIANNFPLQSLEAILIFPYALNQPNELYRNQGGLAFTDVSAASGILDLDLLPAGAAAITWSVSMVDVDADGDTDIVWADDQGALPTLKNDPVNGVDRGFIHIAFNDGEGNFTDVALASTPESSSSWMGLGFGDLDCDSNLDIFGSNFGDYHIPTLGLPYQLGDHATRPYFGLGGGAFLEGTVSEGTAFGWGNAVFDADNDGDADVVYYGGLELTLIGLLDNPGTVLENLGCVPGAADLVTRTQAFDGRHLERNVQGAAIGDLDRDGFVDIVTAANWRRPPMLPRLPSPASYGGALDGGASFLPIFAPTATGELVWTGVELEDGDLSIELNDGNDNRGVTIAPVGGIGLAEDAVVNRGGVGAVVSFTPRGHGRTTAMMPITAGSSHLSSHAPEAYFGLGDQRRGTVDVLWPGGVRNRVYRVRAGEILTLPEIPCAIDGDLSPAAYRHCVRSALNDYVAAGVIDHRLRGRLLASAFRAYVSERTAH